MNIYDNNDSEGSNVNLRAIINNPEKFEIIAALETYETLNLTKLSALLQRPRTTLLGHIKILLADNLIEIDSKTSGERWGKFYKMTDEFKQEFTKHRPELYESYEKQSTLIEEHLTDKQIKGYIQARKKFQKETGLTIDRLILHCGFAYFIQKFIFNNIAERDKIDQKNIIFTETDFMEAYYSFFSRGVPISRTVHVMKFDSLISKFFTDFLKLAQEIEEEIKRNKTPPEDIQKYFLHVFGGSLKT